MEESEQSERVLHEVNDMQKQFENDYFRSLMTLKAFYSNYSSNDIICTLFPISLWIKNISCQVRIQFAYMVFGSMSENEFQPENRIKEYKDFKEFTDNLIQILPQFPMFEDYVPEPDWGEIRFFHNKRIYKILYGNNLDGLYEFLEAFNLMHSSIDEVYAQVINRSPIQELENMLHLQQRIIDEIEANFKVENGLDIYPGHIEVPTAEFWQSCLAFYSTIQVQNLFSNEFIARFTCEFGDISETKLSMTTFLNDFDDDKNFRFMFIKNKDSVYPILPRRYPSILISEWGDIFNSNKDAILKKEPEYRLKFNKAVAKYVKLRTKGRPIFENVSVFDKVKHAPSETAYSLAFTTKNKLYLVYLLDACHSDLEVQQNLDALVPIALSDMEILKQEPATILVRKKEEKENRIVAFEAKDGESRKIQPELITLLPRTTISLGYLGIPRELPGQFMFLEDFLGIIDEIEDLASFEDFLNFLDQENNNRNPLNTTLDMFGIYKETLGIVVGGAVEPASITFNSGWGSNFRFDSLRKFWNRYPQNHLFSHPRSYKISDLGSGLARLESKNLFMVVYHIKVNQTDVYINGPFYKMDWEQGRIADLLIQLVQDGLNSFKTELSSHPFFTVIDKAQIFIFPYEITASEKEVEHLRHLNPDDQDFKVESGLLSGNVPAIRMSFNCKKVYDILLNSSNREFESRVLIGVLQGLNEIVAGDLTSVINSILNNSSNLPRFKINLFEKPASFPEFETSVLPEDHDFKAAKKVIAQIALSKNVMPGKYTVEEAKDILNTLKNGLVQLINSKVNEFDLSKTIGYIIAKADALTHKYEMNKLNYEASINQEVNYVREERYSQNLSKYRKNHRNYRYLIEKFIQLFPTGSKTFTEDDLKELLAVIDWLCVIQNGSDIIYYSLFPAGITVDESYRVDVDYNEDFEKQEKMFGEREAALDLETSGNPNDRADSTRDITRFLDELNIAFESDLGFSLHSLTSILDVLVFWPNFNKSVTEAGYYSATKDEIFQISQNALKPDLLSQSKFEAIIDFLTLISDEMLNILDLAEKCNDLPIWEHNKRPMRYNLKPLIFIDGKYYWGAHSVNRTKDIWIANVSAASFPYEAKTSSIKKLLYEERQRSNEGLNIRTAEIVNRYTHFYRKNCKLHRIDKTKNYPIELGDYDVLAYIPESNTILNIECKDLEPPFSVKDARRLRERLFGRNDADSGYFEKVIRRERFLKDNAINIINSIKWPIDNSKQIKIVSLFITRRNYWWTTFPPLETDMAFIRIDLLDDFLKKLL